MVVQEVRGGQGLLNVPALALGTFLSPEEQQWHPRVRALHFPKEQPGPAGVRGAGRLGSRALGRRTRGSWPVGKQG